MRKLVATSLVTFVVLLGSGGTSWSADFSQREKSYKNNDYITAIRVCKTLAEKGNASAQYKMGFMYFLGNVVPKDKKTSVKWMTLAAKGYRLSAEQGNADAQTSMGSMYLQGWGVPQDNKTAMKWYRLAADQGYGAAQYELGGMYDFGKGVLQDNVYAHMWYNLAADSDDTATGRQNASILRSIVAKRMTPSDHTKAQDLARNFVSGLTSSIVTVRESSPSKSGSTGSGFFVSKMGHILTNAHVVRNCGSITVGNTAKKQVATTLLETDQRNDLALLKISNTQMASVESKSLISKLNLKLVPTASERLLRSDDVELGEDVLVSGFPYGDIYRNTIKVTKSIVSANRGIGDDIGQFQMDAAVQPGNSGGPICDATETSSEWS